MATLSAFPLEKEDPNFAADGQVKQSLHSGTVTNPAGIWHPNKSTGQVPFEAYLHYAAIQREKEDELHRSHSSNLEDTPSSTLGALKRKGKGDQHVETEIVPVQDDEKVQEDRRAGTTSSMSVTQEERLQAQQAVRTATWINIFYLITTDILGPYTAPWAFAQLGYVPGVLLFFFFGIAAAYTGLLLWHMYLKLDSDEYPVKTYSDLAERIFGKWARYSINILQTIQLIFNVAVIIISNTQGLSQISKGKVCFSVLAVIWTLIGMTIGQIRSLRNYGGLAHWAIWLNIVVICITMGKCFRAVAHSAPNFVSALKQNAAEKGPVITQAFIQQPSFDSKVVGAMQMVYSYGGAMLFVELMAEMKRPFDFWKGMIFAQIFIISMYMLFGVYVYSFQGQFTINPANQGISTFGLQTAANVIALVASIIAAGLYGNIGLKVIYVNIVQGLFGGPHIISRAGRFIWVGMVLGYWALAFIIASAVPQFSNISSIVAAICILQFTYTFPPIFFVGFMVRKSAMEGDAVYTPGAPHSTFRADTWHSWSRWRRGFFKYWWLNTFNVLLFLAAGATAGLGAFSSIESIIAGFKQSNAATSFGCNAPV